MLVTNAAGDDVSHFAVGPAGPELVDQVATGGTAPKSVTKHEGLVYVLNAGDSRLTGFRVAGGRLRPLDGSLRRLSAPEPEGALVSFTPDGSTLVTEAFGAQAGKAAASSYRIERARSSHAPGRPATG